MHRLTKKMPKRHPFYYMCMNDLRLIFRQSTYLGRDRKLNTPNPHNIITNLDKFIRKWKNMESQDWRIVNDNVLKEIECLKVHINKGCLSNIPPGAGTNRNERLHRHVRPHFSHTRLDLPLAVALMTVLLYQHNSRLIENITGYPSKPITYGSISSHHFQFGVIDKHVQQTIMWGTHNIGKFACLSRRF